jgi:hypothetical protein
MNFKFIDFGERFYSELKNLAGEFIGTVKPGEVHDLAEAPADGRWAKSDEPAIPAPAPLPSPAASPAPVPASPAPKPADPAPTPAPAPAEPVSMSFEPSATPVS